MGLLIDKQSRVEFCESYEKKKPFQKALCYKQCIQALLWEQ